MDGSTQLQGSLHQHDVNKTITERYFVSEILNPAWCTIVASQIGPFTSPEQEKRRGPPSILLGWFCLQNKKQAGTLSKPAMNALLLGAANEHQLKKRHPYA
jgi:hypothetical protein